MTKVLGVKEAANYLGVGRQTLRRWAREEKIPCRIIPHTYRCTYLFPQSELDEFMTSNSQPKVTKPTLNFGGLHASKKKKH
jgi:excisionase family DNA binding protein